MPKKSKNKAPERGPSPAPSSSGPQFTPGPWLLRKKWSNDDEALEVFPDEETEEHFIPTGVCDVNECRDEAVANARLIAAAPDLLDALLRWLDTDTSISECHSRSREAVAKALGQNGAG